VYAPLTTRDSNGLHPNLRGLHVMRGLGALGDAMTPDDALSQAESGENSPDFGDASWKSYAISDIQNGNIYLAPGGCSGQPAPSVNLFSTASGLALGTTSATTGILGATGLIGAGTGALLGAATMGVGLIISVIGMIFAHHAAAVKQEQQLYCAAIQAANNALAVIAQAVANGQASPADAAASLDSLYQQASSYVAPAVQHNPCNANCELMVVLKAIVLYQESQYQAAAAQAAAVANEQATAEAENAGANTPASSLTSPTLPVSASSGTTSTGASTAAVTSPAVISTVQPWYDEIPIWAWALAAAGFAWAVL